MSLEQLREIRERRLEKMTLEVSRSREKMQHSEKAIQEKQQALDDFIKWRTDEQNNQFDNLQGGMFSAQDIHKYMDNQERMKGDEVKYQEAIKEAEEAFELAQQQYKKVHLELEDMSKKVEKIKEIIKEEKEGAEKESSRQEEAQNEEISNIMYR